MSGPVTYGRIYTDGLLTIDRYPEGLTIAIDGRSVGIPVKALPELAVRLTASPLDGVTYPDGTVRYESRTQRGLWFWAEPNGGGAGADESYRVASQVDGYPATEAHDDWFHHFADADAIARKLARGEAVT